MAYRELKIYLSDSACNLLKPVTPDLFGSSCTRFMDGFMITLELLILASAIGFVIALAVVLARVSGKPLLSVPAYLFTYLFRGTPFLVQLWIFYFGFGSIGAERLGAFWPLFKDAWSVGLLVLTLNTAAYVAEILRGGIENVPRGQVEASEACGMSWAQRMRRIILPQALRIAWPAYGNEVILLMKASALVSTITVLDLMGQTRTIFSRSYSLEIFVYGAILYLLLTTLLTLILRAIETSMSIPSVTPKSVSSK